MFWKKKQTEAKAKEAKPQKAKKLPPKEVMISQIKQLGPGLSLTCQLPKYLWSSLGGFLIVELNPQYPGKGRKYIVYTDRIADGKPAGQKKRFFDSDKPQDIVGWIIDKGVELFSGTEEVATSS